MRVIFAVIVFLGAVIPAWAELHFSEIKGLSKLIQLSDRCSHLNFVFPLLERHQSRYINIFNYAPGERSAAPDPSELLVQGLFSVPPDTDNPIFLSTSPLSRKFGRFLSPTTLGKILAIIETSDPMADPGALKQALKTAMSEDDDFKILTENSKETAKAILARREALEVAQLIKKIKEQMDQKKTELKTLQSERKGPRCHEARFSQIKDLRNDIATVAQRVANVKKQKDLGQELVNLEKEYKRLSETEEYKRLTDQYNSHRYDHSFMGEFLDKLVKSLQSERNPSQGGRYPKYFTEQVLLTLALLNTPDHDKGYFLKLYSQLPEHCFKGRKKPDLSSPLMKEQYSSKDYINIKTNVRVTPVKHADLFIQNPEEAALLRYGNRIFGIDEVPILPYKTVSLEHPSKESISFPDCMETSLLNFFAIIKQDKTGLLGGKSLQAGLNDKGYHLDDKAESFFNVYQDSASLDTRQAHEQWAALMSFLDGVHYKKGDYEIKSEIDNLFAVMEKLIQPNKPGVLTLFEGLSTRQEKMNRLCKVLSHEDLSLSWNIPGDNKADLDGNNYARLQFSGEKPSSSEKGVYFEWKVADGHSEIATLGKAIPYAEQVLGKLFLNKLLPGDRSSLNYKLTTLFVSSTEVPALAKKLDIKAHSNEYGFLQQGFAVSTVREKLELAANMMSGLDPHSLEWVKRLIGSIPRTDLSAQSLVMNFMIKHGLDKIEGLQKEFKNAAQILGNQPKLAVLYSAQNELLGTLQYLKARNFPFNVHNDELNNPLHLLVEHSHPNIECFKVIVSSHPGLLTQLNFVDKTPLHSSFVQRSVPTVMMILDEMQSRGMDINTKDIHTLSFAISLGDIELIKALAERENKTFRQAIEGFRYKTEDSEPLKEMNALSTIIENKNAKFLRYLFNNEKELFIKLLSNEDKKFGSPLKQLAKTIEGTSYSDTIFTEDLSKDLPEIFSLQETKNGATLLHLIAEGQQAKTVKFALEFLGTKVNDDSFLDHQGASPLHRAAASTGFTPATEEITTALAKANPNWVKLKDKDGKTPLDLAKTPEMVQLLKKLAGE